MAAGPRPPARRTRLREALQFLAHTYTQKVLLPRVSVPAYRLRATLHTVAAFENGTAGVFVLGTTTPNGVNTDEHFCRLILRYADGFIHDTNFGLMRLTYRPGPDAEGGRNLRLRPHLPRLPQFGRWSAIPHRPGHTCRRAHAALLLTHQATAHVLELTVTPADVRATINGTPAGTWRTNDIGWPLPDAWRRGPGPQSFPVAARLGLYVSNANVRFTDVTLTPLTPSR